MKQSLAVSLFFFIFLTSSVSSPQWKKLPSYNGLSANCLAATSTRIFAGSDNGHIYLSTDLGKTWVISLGGLGEKIIAIAASGDTLIAADRYRVYVSYTNGEDWSPVFFWNQYLLSVGVNGGVLYVGTVDKILRLRNFGNKWDTIHTGFETFAFAFSPTTLIAGNFLSIDGGKSWVTYGCETFAYSLLFKESDIYVGTREGICISYDNGNHWDYKADGVSGVPGGTLQSIVSNDSNIYVASDPGGIFISSNNGTTWSNMNNDSNAYWQINALLIKDGKIFAGDKTGIWVRNLSGKPDKTYDIDSTLYLYPNPTTGILSVQYMPKDFLSISIVNVLGGTVMEIANPHVENFSIDISTLIRGIYYARFVLPNSVEIRKIIKD